MKKIIWIMVSLTAAIFFTFFISFTSPKIPFALSSQSKHSEEADSNRYYFSSSIPSTSVKALSIAELEDVKSYNLPPKILSFHEIKSKALRSKADEEQAFELASDRETIADAAALLNVYDTHEHPALARRKRMVLVDYLAFAMKRGSATEYVKKTIIDLLTSEFGSAIKDASADVKRGYVGDRVELALALHRVDTQAFERVKHDVTGTALEKIIAYAERMSAVPERGST